MKVQEFTYRNSIYGGERNFFSETYVVPFSFNIKYILKFYDIYLILKTYRGKSKYTHFMGFVLQFQRGL